MVKAHAEAIQNRPCTIKRPLHKILCSGLADWHLVGVPLPTFLLARWACSSTFSTSNATLYTAIIVHLPENIQSYAEAIQNRVFHGIQTPRAVLEWSKQVKRLVSVCTL